MILLAAHWDKLFRWHDGVLSIDSDFALLLIIAFGAYMTFK